MDPPQGQRPVRECHHVAKLGRKWISPKYDWIWENKIAGIRQGRRRIGKPRTKVSPTDDIKVIKSDYAR